MNLKIFLVSYIFLFNFEVSAHRQRRYLRFPKGAQFTVTIAITTFLPKDVPDGFGHVIEFDYGYPFPERVALDRPKPTTTTTTTPSPVLFWDPYLEQFVIHEKKKRMKRSRKDIERKAVIKILREIIESLGYDGPNCITRFQCELERISRNRTIIEDIILVLFKPATPHSPQTCENAAKSCPISILQILLHSEQVTNPEHFF